MPDIAGMPAVAVVPTAGFADGMYPVFKPRPVAGGIAGARLLGKAPAVHDDRVERTLGQRRLPLEALRRRRFGLRSLHQRVAGFRGVRRVTAFGSVGWAAGAGIIRRIAGFGRVNCFAGDGMARRAAGRRSGVVRGVVRGRRRHYCAADEIGRHGLRYRARRAH